MKNKVFLLALCLIVALGIFEAQGRKKSSRRHKAKTEIQQGQQSFRVNGVKFVMVTVDGGTFTMGASDNDAEATPREKPAHQVTVNTFAIGQTEVTQELWRAVMGKTLNKGEFKGRKRPMENVAYYDCEEFIAELNKLTGKTFRLPTEAEWEFAARGGNKSKGYKYAGSNNLNTVAWYKGNSGDKTHPVAQKLPNELGIYDMSGNVWEWTSDWWADTADLVAEQGTDYAGPATGTVRTLSGGGWDYGAEYCAVSFRSYDPIDKAVNSLGFRLVLK